MNPRIVGIEWSDGASPEALVEALSEEALTVAVLGALLEDPAMHEKAEAALRRAPGGVAGP